MLVFSGLLWPSARYSCGLLVTHKKAIKTSLSQRNYGNRRSFMLAVRSESRSNVMKPELRIRLSLARFKEDFTAKHSCFKL